MAQEEITKRVGLLGAGYISNWHAAALKNVSTANLVAVCDRSQSAAETLAVAHGVEHVFTSLDDMLASGSCDVVHVLLPAQTHVEPTRQILEAGCHAFVEKPFALTCAQCDALNSLADSRGLRLGVNHNFLALPSYQALKKDLLDRTLGPIDNLTVNWDFPFPPMRSGPFSLWPISAPENILYEIGPHIFAFVCDLVGCLVELEVFPSNRIETPDGIVLYQKWQMVGRSKSGTVTLNMSFVEGADRRTVEVRCLGGIARANFADDTYVREMPFAYESFVAGFAKQLSVSRQAMAYGARNFFRQLTSFNRLSPYGLSMTKAVELFYADLDKPLDTCLNARSTRQVTEMLEKAIEKARPKLSSKRPRKRLRSIKPTVLVIGGTGFIGRELVRQLLNSGVGVRIFTRGSGGDSQADTGARIFAGSLDKQADLAAALNGIEYVFHLGKANETTWEGYLKNDVAVTDRIADSCLDADIKRLIYTGSIASYDMSDSDQMITEETGFGQALNKRNLYARSKAESERVLLGMHRDRGLPVVIVRPGIVLGPGGPLQHWGIALWRASTVCKFWGDGENPLPFVLVDDVARGLIASMTAEGIEGESFNLVSDVTLSAKDYIDAVSEQVGVKIRGYSGNLLGYFLMDHVKYTLKQLLGRKAVAAPSIYRDWKSRAHLSRFSNAKAKERLGWQPVAHPKTFIDKAVYEANLFGLDDQVHVPASAISRDRVP